MNKREAKTTALGLANQLLNETSVPDELARRGFHYAPEDGDRIQVEWGGIVQSLNARYRKLVVTSRLEPPFHTPGTPVPAHLAAPTGETCPECGAEVLLRSGKNGRFRSCSRFPDCPWKGPFVIGPCPACRQGSLVEKGGKRGVFWGCSRYPDCTYTQDPDILTDR
jgi:hypothetical protein